MNNSLCTALLSLLCVGLPSWASETSTASPAPASQSDPAVKKTEPPDTTSDSSSILPFFGDEARARGYDLPEPFGININYINIRQNLNVNSIKFNGLALGSLPLDNFFNINVGHTRERSKTETLKLDAWLFPFMNVYGLVGHTRGHSVSNIGVGVNAFGKAVYPPNLQNLKFQLDFKGTTYGVGTTLVGGYDNWFTSVDANYTETRFDILDGSINAFTLTPRVGYSFTTPGVDTLHMPDGKLNVWVGTMYQDVQQEFKGKLSDLHMPSTDLDQMVNLANKNGRGRFDVKQHLTSPWNVLVGAQYALTRNIDITSEVGFAARNSFFVSGEYRF